MVGLKVMAMLGVGYIWFPSNGATQTSFFFNKKLNCKYLLGPCIIGKPAPIK